MKSFEDSAKEKILFLIFTALAGLIILYPFLNFQPTLSQGDHGSNLYAFQQVFHGRVPYQDFWYPYGPLMPYYYSLFFRLLGENIQSVLAGVVFLKFLGGIFCYLALSIFIPAFLAFAAAVWFWVFNPDFFFNFNHIGAVTCSLACVYCLFLYFKKLNPWAFLGGLLSALFILFIRVNMGIFILLAFLFCVGWARWLKGKLSVKRHKPHFILFLLILFLSFIFLRQLSWEGSSVYSVKTYLSYFKNLLNPLVFLARLEFYFKQLWEMNTSALSNAIFAVLGLLTLFRTGQILFSRRDEQNQKQFILFTLGSSLIFLIAASHEYFASGIVYRLAWLLPFETLFIFLSIGFATRHIKSPIPPLIYFAVFLIPLIQIFNVQDAIGTLKTSKNYLAVPRGQIYVGNSRRWITTVKQTTDYLNNHLQKDETFLALPYESIYYFLTGKESPTWMLSLIQAHASSELEENILKILETKNIQYVVLSNRMNSREDGVGILGTTYFKRVYNYIMGNYEVTAAFGKWDAPAQWAENHAVRILKRKK